MWWQPLNIWEDTCLCQLDMPKFMGGGGQDIRARQPVWAPPVFHLFNSPQCTCHCLSHKKVLIPARVSQRYPREPCKEQGCPDTPICPKLSYICRNILSNLRYSGLVHPHPQGAGLSLYTQCLPPLLGSSLSSPDSKKPCSAMCHVCFNKNGGPHTFYSVAIQWSLYRHRESGPTP